MVVDLSQCARSSGRHGSEAKVAFLKKDKETIPGKGERKQAQYRLSLPCPHRPPRRGEAKKKHLAVGWRLRSGHRTDRCLGAVRLQTSAPFTAARETRPPETKVGIHARGVEASLGQFYSPTCYNSTKGLTAAHLASNARSRLSAQIRHFGINPGILTIARRRPRTVQTSNDGSDHPQVKSTRDDEHSLQPNPTRPPLPKQHVKHPIMIFAASQPCP